MTAITIFQCTFGRRRQHKVPPVKYKSHCKWNKIKTKQEKMVKIECNTTHWIELLQLKRQKMKISRWQTATSMHWIRWDVNESKSTEEWIKEEASGTREKPWNKINFTLLNAPKICVGAGVNVVVHDIRNINTRSVVGSVGIFSENKCVIRVLLRVFFLNFRGKYYEAKLKTYNKRAQKSSDNNK